MRFTAKEDFFSDEMQSQYVKGMTYNAEPDNEKLLEMVEHWIEDDLVEEGGPEAQVTGTAEVEDKET
jgi:hypothetical protein